jgi:serine/threonine protein kinase
VLLASDGPRIIDFGIASAAEATALTGTGFLIGSPGFMSPEQAQGHVVGPASDIFSLGAVLGFAATGQGPFGTGDTAALLYRVVHGRPDLSQVPGKLRPLLRRSLAKDPARRPTADQFLADLTAAYPSAPNLTGDWLPPQILAASPAPVLAPDGDRHEPVASGPRSVAVPPAPPTQTAAAPPAPAAGRRRLWPWVAAGSTVCAAVIAILIVSLIPGSASAPTVPPNTRCVAFHPTPSAPRGTPISGSIKGSRR